jgi:pimeloyl-ACP methyl ester carboxylesterase
MTSQASLEPIRDHVTSSDGTSIHFEVSGQGEVALVFVHGWLGNLRWWDAQRAHFAAKFRVVTLDLAGHGQSGTTRTAWSIAHYADDIRAVVARVGAPRVVLIGHSMSGPNVIAAARDNPAVIGIVLVDTMKNLDSSIPPEIVRQMLALYASDFRHAVEQVIPAYLYAPGTPAAVRARLQGEFLAAPADLPVRAIEPLYLDCDLQQIASSARVPVRAIHSDVEPIDAAINRKYFRDYDFVTVTGVGHYPMLEQPAKFDRALEACLRDFGL